MMRIPALFINISMGAYFSAIRLTASGSVTSSWSIVALTSAWVRAFFRLSALAGFRIVAITS